MALTGILGGTFNPIHNGHLLLADTAYKELKLNKVLIMPSGVSYLKAANNIVSREHRGNMARLASLSRDYFEFSDIELLREGNTYTYETLELLNKTNPSDKYYFILGADSLFSMESWIKPEVIFNLCTICVAVRDDADMKALKLKAREYETKFNASIKFLHMKRVDISSTMIRQMIKNNQDVSNYLPDNVYKYIKENNLYKEVI